MPVPVKRLRKSQLEWLGTHYCKCGHTYLEHWGCYLKENPSDSPLYEKIAFFDIESGGSLTADWGYTLTYCLKELDGPTIKRFITPNEVRNKKVRDKRLLKQFCQDVKQFDKLVVYYGKDAPNRHDIPFLRTRSAKWGVTDFPKWKEKKVVDVYDIIKTKFKLARRRMDDACRLFNIPSKATPLNPDVWQDALAGKEWAIKYILKHNEEDVISLEKLWKLVVQYKGSQTTT